MIVDINTAPFVTMALDGLHPFMPDIGVLCGGYQGPLYPNPMSLISPDTGFNPLIFRNFIMSNYTMKTASDFYLGLGVGNPGIDYRNPGHILGILDTYGRMSYGLGVIAASRSAQTGSTITPPVTVAFTLKSFKEDGLISKFLLLSDIYPSLSEIPSDYVNTYIGEDGEFTNTPFTNNFFVFNTDNSHVPQTSLIFSDNMIPIFDKVHAVATYVDLPFEIRDLFNTMAEYASDNLGSQKEVEIVNGFSPPEVLLNESFTIQPLPKLPLELPEGTPGSTRIGMLANEVHRSPEIDFDSFSVPATYMNDNKILTREEALQVFNGRTTFHNNSETQHEYRTMTELNAVVNLVPIQMNAFKHSTFATAAIGSGTNFLHSSWAIVDICLNIVNINHSDEDVLGNDITIAGTATLDGSDYLLNIPPLLRSINCTSTSSPISKYVSGTIYALGWISREFKFQTSLTNKFTWDRDWLGLTTTNELSTVQEKSKLIARSGGARVKDPVTIQCQDIFGFNFTRTQQDQGDPPVGFEFSTSFNFSESLTLQPGNNNVRARLVVQNVMKVAGRSTVNHLVDSADDISITINISSSRFPTISKSFDFSPSAPFSTSFYALRRAGAILGL